MAVRRRPASGYDVVITAGSLISYSFISLLLVSFILVTTDRGAYVSSLWLAPTAALWHETGWSLSFCIHCQRSLCYDVHQSFLLESCGGYDVVSIAGQVAQPL